MDRSQSHATRIKARAVPWKLQSIRDDRGLLVVVEGQRSVSFPIKRVFYVCDVPNGAVRGGHAHRDCEQLLVCIAGRLRVTAGDQEFVLKDKDVGLYVPPDIRVTMDDWQQETVLMVLCSHYYDEDDYLDPVS